MDDIFGLLSVCRRAGKLICGSDEVKESCLRKEARLVITASDFSERSKREIEALCRREKIPHVTISRTMDDVGEKIGKRFGVMSVCDRGFADAVMKKLSPKP